MSVLNLLTLPFKIIFYFIIHPLARFILKEDLEKEELLKRDLFFKIKNLRNDKEILTKLNDEFTIKQNRLKKSIIKNKDFRISELMVTDEGEFIIINYSRKQLFDTIFLISERGNHSVYDCKMEMITDGQTIKITNFESTKRGFGYGKILMDFVIDKAIQKGIKTICGELSDVDEDGFERLIPFYESFNFKCKWYDEPRGRMLGKIEMIIEQNTIS